MALEFQLETGDRLVLCSDGIIESENGAGALFGFERTADAIREASAEGLSAEALIDRLLAEVRSFCGEVAQVDDMTCVVVRVTG